MYPLSQIDMPTKFGYSTSNYVTIYKRTDKHFLNINIYI